MGPLTHCHLDLALVSLTKVRTHAFLILSLVASLLLFHMSVHDSPCLKGIVTLGSAVSFLWRPFLKGYLRAEDAHVPADMSPVAFATLLFAFLMLVGHAYCCESVLLRRFDSGDGCSPYCGIPFCKGIASPGLLRSCIESLLLLDGCAAVR